MQRHNRIANQCFTSKKENPIHEGVECRPKEGERLRRLKIFVIELNKKILFSKLLCKTMMSLISFSIKTRRPVLKSLSNHKKWKNPHQNNRALKQMIPKHKLYRKQYQWYQWKPSFSILSNSIRRKLKSETW